MKYPIRSTWKIYSVKAARSPDHTHNIISIVVEWSDSLFDLSVCNVSFHDIPNVTMRWVGNKHKKLMFPVRTNVISTDFVEVA